MKLFFRFSILSLIFFTAACASLAQDITPPPGYEYVPPPPTQEVMYYPSVPPNPVAGAAIYAEKCQPCHGEGGLGNGPDANKLPNPVSPIGDADFARESYPGAWFQVVTEGRIDRFMPPFQSLTERQRWDVLAYVYTLSAPSETVALGQTIFQEQCVACHGETGAGDGPDAVRFGASMPSFVDQVLMSERSKADLFEGMTHANLPEIPNLTIGLTEAERWALTDYLRSLTFAAPEEDIADLNPFATVATEEQTPTAPGTPVAETQPELVDEAPVGDGQGIVTGQVVNLSGEAVPVGQEVVLHGFDQFQEVISITTQVDGDGMYRFEGVQIPEGRAFIVSVDYKETTYTSDLAVVQSGVTTYEMPVSIYETTTDKSGLVIDRLHVLFEFVSTEQVRVAELIIISNLSNRVVISEDDSPLISFSLPEGAANLQFQEGALGRDFIETPTGFADMRAVLPGEGRHQVLFSYDMPYENQVEISQVIELPVQSLVVLSPAIGVSVTGEGLVSSGVQDVEGTPYEVFTGEGFSAGGELSLSLSGRPDLGSGASVITPSSTSSLALGLGALGVSLLGVGVWLFRRSNRATETEEDMEEVEDEMPENGMNADSLMDAIIALDDRYKAGDLPEEAYLRRRAVLKEQLKKHLG
ncbi:MAG: hypothetical protein Fur0022_29830 [Anaerolineales bacterium]